MKIALASDVHGLWYDLDYPNADILIFAGDLFDFYSSDRKLNAKEQLSEVEQFNLFLGHYGSKYQKIIIVGGNHDFVLQQYPEKSKKILTNATLLQDSSCEFRGYKFYGSPWQPWFGNWAFNFINHHENFFAAQKQAQECWAKIPKDTEILITHTPPLGILDKTARGTKVGCQFLTERLDELPNLLLHVFGHIHASRGHETKNGLLSVNAANSYTHSKVSYPMYVVEISEDALAKIILPTQKNL